MKELEGQYKLQREIEMKMYISKPRGEYRPNYIPQTFEAMMESFGIKLQRKAVYEEFLNSHSALGPMMKSNAPAKDIFN